MIVERAIFAGVHGFDVGKAGGEVLKPAVDQVADGWQHADQVELRRAVMMHSELRPVGGTNYSRFAGEVYAARLVVGISAGA